MEWINYHHLLYFWMVAREGSIAKACRQLRLAQPTISAQLKALEENLGEQLFVRSGRNLVLTDVGKVVYRYADEIFSLGREMLSSIRGRPVGSPVRLVVGISDAVPKLVVFRLLEPALHMPTPVRLICLENKPQQLLMELMAHTLDLVLTDAPAGPETRIKAYNHVLGECPVSFFADPKRAAQMRRNFPACLDGAPFLFPAEGTALRRSLEQWFENHGIRPLVVAEIVDSALIKTMGSKGLGAFAAPSIIEEEVKQQYAVSPIGTAGPVRERFYAISVERKLKNPAVLAITAAARDMLETPRTL
jgi:LysR family transcriptional activator of nhaA